jgi:hypothetical protein
MIYFQIQNNTGKIIAGNMGEFLRKKEFEENRTFSLHSKGQGIKGVEKMIDGIRIWVVVENESDLLKSSKLFEKSVEVYRRVAIDVWRHHKAQIEAHAHILTTIQSQIRQKIEGFAEDSDFYGESFSQSVQKILEIITHDPAACSDLLCYIHKRVTDMRAHLLGTEVIHLGTQYEVRLAAVSLKRAILNQCTPFLDELGANSVTVKFAPYLDDNFEVVVDKSMFSLIMYNFFSNAAKYCKFGSEIRFNYFEDNSLLDVSMISLKMEQSELQKLSDEGVRGVHSITDFPGKGIGLYVIQRALDLMGKRRMFIRPKYEKSYQENDHTYIENHFEFFFT